LKDRADEEAMRRLRADSEMRWANLLQDLTWTGARHGEAWPMSEPGLMVFSALDKRVGIVHNEAHVPGSPAGNFAAFVILVRTLSKHWKGPDITDKIMACSQDDANKRKKAQSAVKRLLAAANELSELLRDDLALGKRHKKGVAQNIAELEKRGLVTKKGGQYRVVGQDDEKGQGPSMYG